MSRIEDLKASVSKAEEKVAKCKATIERHEQQLAKKEEALAKKAGAHEPKDVWEVERKKEDIKGAQKKLKYAEEVLEGWIAKLNVEIEKERFLSEQAPAVIIEFLAKWKEMAREWYLRAFVAYIDLQVDLDDAEERAEEEFLANNPGARAWGREYDTFMKKHEAIRKIKQDIAMYGGAVKTMASYYKEENRLEWLEKTLEDERRAKLFDLITRVNEITGTITDAGALRIDPKGNLNGIIVGEKGKAEVQTIGAGGWNIQCFHYRTLIHKIKESA